VKRQLRALVPVALVLAALVAAAGGAQAAPKKADPAPSASASPSPVPSPTATPEPLDKAIPRLEALVKANPNDRDSMARLAQDYLEINRPDLTLPVTAKLVSLGVKSAQVYYTEGYANQQLGRTNEAVADFENAANLEPTNASVLASLTSLYLRLNRNSDAERVAKRALTFNKNDKNSMINYGLVLSAEQKYDESRAQFEAAAKADPTDANPLVLEARTYVEQKAIALASAEYDRAIAVDPKNLDALIGRARIAGDQHDVKTAIATYEKINALQTAPEDKAAVIDEEAKVYAAEKMTTEADTAYKLAISSYPTAYGAHLAYGDYLASNKDLAGAEREWILGEGPKKDQPDAVARLGALYLQQNKIPQATEAFKSVSGLAPNDPRAFFALAEIYGKQRNWSAARDNYRRAYEISHSPEALVGLGQIDIQMKNYKECAVIFDSIDKAPGGIMSKNPTLLYALGTCQQGDHQNAAAKGSYTRLLAFLKADSDDAKQVRKLIASVGSSPAKPGTKPTPKPAASH
jgi:tetratricopeptide (TPR) repeat protein